MHTLIHTGLDTYAHTHKCVHIVLLISTFICVCVFVCKYLCIITLTLFLEVVEIDMLKCWNLTWFHFVKRYTHGNHLQRLAHTSMLQISAFNCHLAPDLVSPDILKHPCFLHYKGLFVWMEEENVEDYSEHSDSQTHKELSFCLQSITSKLFMLLSKTI